jgi:hypothetical protein
LEVELSTSSRWDKVMPRVKALKKMIADGDGDDEYPSEDPLLKSV